MSHTQQVLLVLARDRQHDLTRAAAASRRFRLRHRIARLVYRLAFACAGLGAMLDDDPVRGTLSA